MVRKVLKFLLLLVIIIPLLVLTTHFVLLRFDYVEIMEGKEPIFAKKVSIAADGGTILYSGFLYEIYSRHSLTEDLKGFMVGPQVQGVPVLDTIDQLIAKEDLRYVSMEED